MTPYTAVTNCLKQPSPVQGEGDVERIVLVASAFEGLLLKNPEADALRIIDRLAQHPRPRQRCAESNARQSFGRPPLRGGALMQCWVHTRTH